MSSQSILNGKEKKFYYSGISTVGAVSSNIASIAVPNNSSLMVNVKCMALCSASSGADLNKLLVNEYSVACKNISGSLTTYLVNSSVSSDDTFAPSLSQSISSTNLIISCTGVTGDTINYSGIYTISYQ